MRKGTGTVTAYLPLPNGIRKRYCVPNTPTAIGEIVSRWEIDCILIDAGWLVF